MFLFFHSITFSSKSHKKKQIMNVAMNTKSSALSPFPFFRNIFKKWHKNDKKSKLCILSLKTSVYIFYIIHVCDVIMMQIADLIRVVIFLLDNLHIHLSIPFTYHKKKFYNFLCPGLMSSSKRKASSSPPSWWHVRRSAYWNVWLFSFSCKTTATLVYSLLVGHFSFYFVKVAAKKSHIHYFSEKCEIYKKCTFFC